MESCRKFMGVLLAIIMILSTFGFYSQNVYASTINAGAGSYTDILPAGQVGPQSTVYKTSNLTGAIPTSSWESSILWTQYSEAMYPIPLSVKFTGGGLQVCRPQKSGEGTSSYTGRYVLWEHNPNNPDMTIKNSNYSSYTDAHADKITDWSLDGVLTSGSTSVLKATITEGSPYIYFDFPTGNPQIVFNTAPTVFYGDSNSQYLGITINGLNYGLFAPTGATWSGIGTTTITCNLPSGKTYFSIAGLPDNTISTLNYFKNRAYAFITDTKVSWSYDENNSHVTTTYTISTIAKEGTNLDTIIGLYPHQWRDNSLSYLPYTYNTVRGLMKTISGTGFTTTYKYYGILPTIPLNGSEPSILNSLLNSESIAISSSDTYWNGKDQNRVSSVVQLAKMNNNTTVFNNALSNLESNLEDWFTYSGSSDSKCFYYDPTWGTLIGYLASYGSNDQLNDHHFHYGYFINAAAQIALVDKNWADQSQWGSMVNLLIKDIANWDRTDARFPFLRNFDPYSGHSWASGNAIFTDGNNQESFSEAMNAWQAIILWGTATGQTAIRDLGIYMYTTEAESMYNYVFDLYHDVIDHSGVYNWNYSSMIWGGKYCAEIWWDPGSTANFAAQSRGIELLPITGGSFYLAKDKNYIQNYYNEMLTQGGTTEPSSWQDIWYMYLALSDPSTALSKWNSSIGNETGQSKSFTYAWLNALNTLGVPDMTVTANTPLYQVFNKNGAKTYVVYNPTNNQLTVTFSDGKVITASANSLMIDSGNSSSTSSSSYLPQTTWYLFNQQTSGVTPVGEDLQTANSSVTGWQPITTISSTTQNWYSPTINGTYKAGTWQFILWTNSPGSSSLVKVEIYKVNNYGSGETLIGSQTVDVNTTGTGNHQSIFSISTVSDINFNNQRIRVSITKVSGVDCIMAYNTNDFPTRLVTP